MRWLGLILTDAFSVIVWCARPQLSFLVVQLFLVPFLIFLKLLHLLFLQFGKVRCVSNIRQFILDTIVPINIVVHVQYERKADKIIELDPVLRDEIIGKPVDNQRQDFWKLEETRPPLGVHLFVAVTAKVLILTRKQLRLEVVLKGFEDVVIIDLIKVVFDGQSYIEKILISDGLGAAFQAFDIVLADSSIYVWDEVLVFVARKRFLDCIEQNSDKLLAVVLLERLVLRPPEALNQIFCVDLPVVLELHVCKQLL